MTWVLLGGHGQLGRSLQLVLEDEAIPFEAPTHNEVDITEIDSIEDYISDSDHGVVVNLAAWTDVDGAESNRDSAFLINAIGAENVATVASRRQIPLVHISTDYVFNGKKNSPYLVGDRTSPLSIYGMSKLEGERRVLAQHPERSWIVRTAWLYSQFGRNFAKTIVQKGLAGESLSVIADVFGQPTSSTALARQIVKLVQTCPDSGIFHGTNSGQASWYEFAEELLKGLDKQVEIRPVSSAEFASVAERPQYSVLDHSQWTNVGISPMPHWKKSLSEIFDEIIISVGDTSL